MTGIIDPQSHTLKHTGDTHIYENMVKTLPQSNTQKRNRIRDDKKFDAGRIDSDAHAESQLTRAANIFSSGYQTDPEEKIFTAAPPIQM